jgi:hypothetical protein
VTGTPTNTGPYNFTVRATNAYGWSNRIYDLVISAAPVFITTSPLPSGSLGVSYSNQILATGSLFFTLVGGSLPDGLELGAADGWITGTPTNSGTFNFTVNAWNNSGSSNRVFDLTILGQINLRFTNIWAASGGVRIDWTNPTPGNVQVWRATNITVPTVNWSNLGVQTSPWTNVAPATPAFYQLRLSP